MSYEYRMQVYAPHYTAGVIFDLSFICIEAAPIVRWLIGKSADEIIGYLQRKNYRYAWL